MENPVVYLDSMVFIYAVEGDIDTAPSAREMLAVLRRRPGVALTSELSLAEVLAPTDRDRGPEQDRAPKHIPLHLRTRLYSDLMISSDFLALAPVTRDILLETANIRGTKPHKLPDAIHLATALRTGCTFFVSADRRIRTPASMTKLAPDAVGIARLMEAIH